MGESMKARFFIRALSLIAAGVMLTTTFTSCKKDKEEEVPNTNFYDLTGFTIIRDSAGGPDIASATADLKKALEETVGVSLTVGADVDIAAGEKEILIGETNRQESKITVEQLKNANEKNSYTIRIADNKIVITGTDDFSTKRAVSEFINIYVKPSSKGSSIDISAGREQNGIYDKDSAYELANGAILHVDYVSSVIEPYYKMTLPNGSSFIPTGGSYPAITQLSYQSNPEDNGKLIAILSAGSVAGSNTTGGAGCVMMSEDDGKTWQCIARPAETLYPDLSSQGSMAHVYELPAQVGEMPAGTLLYSYNSVDYSTTSGKSILAVWRSFDCGYTWEEYVIIDEAGGLKEGVWEPFMIYSEEDQYLYCFYSDDSDPDHDQKVVYKRSKDGVKWEGEGGKIGSGTGKDVEPVDVVAMANSASRPGMPVITKMGNGEYFMVYEFFATGAGDCPIYYRTTKDLSDWGDPNNAGTLIPNGKWSSPACAWIDAGGECGVLVVGSKGASNNGYIMISVDYGKTWQTIEDPHASRPIKGDGDRVGYSAGMWVGADKKTLYYINSDNATKYPTSLRKVAIAKITIYDAN